VYFAGRCRKSLMSSLRNFPGLAFMNQLISFFFFLCIVPLLEISGNEWLFLSLSFSTISILRVLLCQVLIHFLISPILFVCSVRCLYRFGSCHRWQCDTFFHFHTMICDLDWYAWELLLLELWRSRVLWCFLRFSPHDLSKSWTPIHFHSLCYQLELKQISTALTWPSVHFCHRQESVVQSVVHSRQSNLSKPLWLTMDSWMLISPSLLSCSLVLLISSFPTNSSIMLYLSSISFFNARDRRLSSSFSQSAGVLLSRNEFLPRKHHHLSGIDIGQSNTGVVE